MIVGYEGNLTAEVRKPGDDTHAQVHRWENGKRVESVFDRTIMGPWAAQRAVRKARKVMSKLAKHDCTEMHGLLSAAQDELGLLR